MHAADAYLFAVNIATLTILSFSASLLIAKTKQNSGYACLASCFIAIAIVICQPSLAVLATNLQQTALIMALPALLAIAPCFWFYIKSLTAEYKWSLSQKDKWHFALPALGLVISLIALALPNDIQYGLLVEGDDAVLKTQANWLITLVYGGLILTFLLVIGWLVQSAFYVVNTVIRLNSYRAHLKDIFASTEQKELNWLTGLALLVGIPWVLFGVNLTLNNLIMPSEMYTPFSSIILLIAVLFLATWALRQKPGFTELFNSTSASRAAAPSQPPKYKTSALSEADLNLIANKLVQAMQAEQLYLDASLSLPKLANALSTPPNYISQTLNERLQVNFFDFVNGYRVTHAKQALTATHSSVLDIAMDSGFNSKSAFYTAFKKYTGVTPVHYRKHNRVQ